MPTWPFEFLGNNAGSGGGGGGSSYIQSIQPFSITIAASSTSNTATISSVNTSNAVIFFGGFTSADISSNYQNWASRAELTNATTVTVFRNTSDTSTITVYGTVVEFTSAAITSVQAGTITIASASASNTATISSVTTANSVVFYLGYTASGSTSVAADFVSSLSLTNATTVTAARNTAASGFAVTVGYCVVNFASTVINSIQQRSVTLTSANTSDTDTISSVTTANALLIYGGSTTVNSTFSNFQYNLQLTGATTVTLTRNGTNTSSRTINYTVLEFKTAVMAASNSLQRGTIAVASVTSNTGTITSVTTGKSVCNWLGFSTSATSNNEAYAAAALTNATTVTGQKNTAGSSTSTVSYEIAQFA